MKRAFLLCMKPVAAPLAGKLLIAGDVPSLAKFALEHGLTPPSSSSGRQRPVDINFNRSIPLRLKGSHCHALPTDGDSAPA